MSGAEVSIVSVNAGGLRTIAVGTRVFETGIHKEPTAGVVQVFVDGITGDSIGDRAHHGGADQAVYLYSAEDSAWWAERLRREIPPGFFGENLTLSCWWPQVRVGDRLQSGTLILELTFPRIPCGTLAARVGDAKFLKAFVAARRSGAYARVVAPGPIAADDRFVVIPAPQSFPTIEAMFDSWHAKSRNKDFLLRALEAPIAERARTAIQGWLA